MKPSLILIFSQNPAFVRLYSNDWHSLHYFQVDISDSGFYSCVAGNILGESVSSAYLDINTSTSSLTAGQATWLGLMAMSLLLHYSHHISLTTTRGLQTSQHLRTLWGVKWRTVNSSLTPNLRRVNLQWRCEDYTCKAMLDISSVRYQCNISIETKCAKNKFIENSV